jgi:hypothetical protein
LEFNTLGIMVKAKDIDHPPNLAIETTADTEVTKIILLVFSREESVITSPPSITRAVVPVVAVDPANHVQGEPSFVPMTIISIGSTYSLNVMAVLEKFLGLQEFPKIFEELFVVRGRVTSSPN